MLWSRRLFWTICGLGAIAALASLVLMVISAASLPRLTGDVRVPELDAPVTLTRDARGIPYIPVSYTHLRAHET